MRLDRLLAGVHVLERRGDPATVTVNSVTHDSRAVAPGALFCCLPGSSSDGHDHAGAAVEAGAVALLCERLLPLDVVQVRVGDARAAMAPVAAELWGHPSRALAVIGVTGTNGKTTTAHLIQSVLVAHGWATAVVGTLGGPRTTPEAPELQAALAHHLGEGAKAVAVEVSSHALDQHRVDAVRFRVAAFTNLSPEHLDYHGDMEAYFEAKAALFDPARAEAAVVNADDPWGRRLLERAEGAGLPAIGWSLADAVGLEPAPGGIRFWWDGEPVALALGGRFNAANAVCAATVGRHLGVPASTVAAGLSSLTGVPGRYERVDAGQPFTVIVDYAHTPAALEEVLAAAREEAGTHRVVVVFGCGGDRDPSKRPLMGAVAARFADLAVLTSDNPRGEDPLAILEQVRAGARGEGSLVVEPDRRVAIEAALARAGPGDVVVVAGKGHETGQTAAGRTAAFDDRQVARAGLARLGHGSAA